MKIVGPLPMSARIVLMTFKQIRSVVNGQRPIRLRSHCGNFMMVIQSAMLVTIPMSSPLRTNPPAVTAIKPVILHSTGNAYCFHAIVGLLSLLVSCSCQVIN